MCMVALTAITTIASTAVGVAGTLAQADAQASSYESQAKMAERQREITADKGVYEAGRLDSQNDRRLNEMQSSYLSSGIALEGAPSDVLQDSATEASLDKQAILYGSEIQQDNLQFEADLARMNAGSARTAGKIGALSAVIGGIGNFAGQMSGIGQSQQGFANQQALSDRRFSQRSALQNRRFSANRTLIRNPYA